MCNVPELAGMSIFMSNSVNRGQGACENGARSGPENLIDICLQYALHAIDGNLLFGMLVRNSSLLEHARVVAQRVAAMISFHHAAWCGGR